MANTHSPGPSLLRLPPELIDHLLDYVPARDLQYTTHILHQVFPDFGLAERFLWRHVVIGRKEQLSPLLKAVKVGRGRRLPLRSFSMVIPSRLRVTSLRYGQLKLVRGLGILCWRRRCID